MEKASYNIYPSLLIKFQELLDYEQVAESPWNKKEDEYVLTPDEMYDKIERELIDTINRAPKGPMEAADKGTAFNEIVDCLIENRKSSREDCQLGKYLNGNMEKVVRAQINDFVFDFDLELCREVAAYFKGSTPQFLAEAEIETSYGRVRLYGFIDEWVGNRMYDIKTTGRYDFGKYEKGWQRHVYPWCVIESGLTTEVESFTYYVVEWAYQGVKDPVIRAKNIYEETYTYDHAESGRKLKAMLESFISWLMANREKITDRKIFNLN